MTERTETRILGIDPGLNITGYGVISVSSDASGSAVSLVEAGVIRSKRSADFGARLNSIHEGVLDVIDSLSPDTIGLEEIYSHYERPQTAIIMGHARGVICLAAQQRERPLANYAATQIKKILTGNGRAPKNQVQLAVARQLSLSEIPEPPDVADALAIALCHYYLALRPSSLT
ncbi:MAG: crossover junction endodeoxyribonuclease RuvC [Mariniblastus sp.]|nr:crossover junction endodeoxyribonuclease RuvC [Mariniblastus sp.]